MQQVSPPHVSPLWPSTNTWPSDSEALQSPGKTQVPPACSQEAGMPRQQTCGLGPFTLQSAVLGASWVGHPAVVPSAAESELCGMHVPPMPAQLGGQQAPLGLCTWFCGQGP